MKNQEQNFARKDENDIDLGSVLNFFARGFSKIGRAFSVFFTSLAALFLHLLLFLKRKFIWLLLATVIGFSFGTYLNFSQGRKYYSDMTARFNFGSSRALYNTVDYLNSLIAENKRKELSRLLAISEPDAAHLVWFDAKPVDDELVVAELYKEHFLDFDRSSRIRTDTFWARTITYETFKENLTKYDIPIHEITAVSTKTDIFPKVGEGLIRIVASSGNLKKNYEINRQMRTEDEQIIVSSLKGLDTLRNVYNERLREQKAGTDPATSHFTVLDKSQLNANPELELYEKVLNFKDELKAVRRDIVDKQDIVQVYSPFNPVGQRVSILKQNAIKYAFYGIALVILLLLAIEAVKALNNYEQKQKRRV